MAQAILANLLANAQATTLECRRLSRPRVQAPSRSVRRSICRMTARAPWTRSRLRFLSPRLLMPSNVGLPPVLYWRGTNPIDAANWRAEANCRASPNSVASTLAVIGPMPGIASRRWPRSSSRSCRINSRSTSPTCSARSGCKRSAELLTWRRETAAIARNIARAYRPRSLYETSETYANEFDPCAHDARAFEQSDRSARLDRYSVTVDWSFW
jgi:hypothetical protein